jgi:hypothetical protein
MTDDLRAAMVAAGIDSGADPLDADGLEAVRAQIAKANQVTFCAPAIRISSCPPSAYAVAHRGGTCLKRSFLYDEK